jgi:hypothetical protein
MVRFVAAIVIGYLVMLLVVFGMFALVYPLVGVDLLFQPGSYQAAAGWITLSLVFGLMAAMSAGQTAMRIAPGTQAPMWLAAIVLVLGGLMAVPVAMSANYTRGGKRSANVTMSDVMAHAEQPLWAAVLNPLVCAAGVLVGAGPPSRRK